MNLPDVQVYALGGTIAMTPDAVASGVVPTLTADDLVATIPGITDVATIKAETLARVGSANLNFPHIKRLIEHASHSDADGFVVTQGTDTMEETSFLASLFWDNKKPLVFTGAMRNPSTPGADGPANLADAVRVAAAGKQGVYLVMNGEIHDPCRVRKAHTSNLAAFISDGGPLGSLVEGFAHFNQSLSRFAQHELPVSLPPVALVPATLGGEGELLDHIIEAGYKGLVVDGFGGGHVNEIWADKLAELAKSIPVIVSSRTGAGRVLTQTYGYKGAEIDLINKGLVTSGRLNGMKARLFLQVALACKLNWRDLLGEYADLA